MSSASWPTTCEAFDQAAAWFVSTAAKGRGRWDEAALGVWTVRDLVGHTSRALLTVEMYLDKPTTAVEVTAPVDYFRVSLATLGEPAAVAERGREAGAALGRDVPQAIGAIADRVRARIRAAEQDDLVATPVGGMRLADYLPTRAFELTVHTCDLATALGQPLDVPEAAAVESISLLGALAARGGRAGPLLRAATGRGGLPNGFTVL